MDDQQRLLERLPDYLNGHVAGADAEQIAALLEHDAAWQAQAALMADLRRTIDAELAEMDATRGLDRLRARIRTTPAPVPPPEPAWWQRLFGQPWLAQGVMAALAVVCVAEAWMLARPHDAGSDVAWRAAPFTVAAPGANLRVEFASGASLAQVEATLAGAHARLVTGPLGQHVYLLQADDASGALALLRASPVVRAASLVDSPPPP